MNNIKKKFFSENQTKPPELETCQKRLWYLHKRKANKKSNILDDDQNPNAGQFLVVDGS
jgi:hypothetical protein